MRLAFLTLLVLLHMRPSDGASSPLVKWPKIVGGKSASFGQFPYQVKIVIQTSSGSYLCGGSIISPYYVLTAAHCFVDESTGTEYNPMTVYITAGIISYLGTESSKQTTTAANVGVDSSYNYQYITNDLTLIRVATPFQFNSYVQPIALPDPSISNFNGQACNISGWGYLQEGSNTPASTLQYAQVNIVALSTCQLALNNVQNAVVVSTNLCATSTGQDTCQGDSGGPVVCTGLQYSPGGSTTQGPVLAGVVSWGVGCAEGYPSVNTNVLSYMTSILKDTGLGTNSNTNPNATPQQDNAFNYTLIQKATTAVSQSVQTNSSPRKYFYYVAWSVTLVLSFLAAVWLHGA